METAAPIPVLDIRFFEKIGCLFSPSRFLAHSPSRFLACLATEVAATLAKSTGVD